MDPPASVPMDRGAIPEASAAADPPEDPPEVRLRSQGLSVRPNRGDSFMGLWPNSGVETLPTKTAPAAFIRATTIASLAGTLCSITAEA